MTRPGKVRVKYEFKDFNMIYICVMEEPEINKGLGGPVVRKCITKIVFSAENSKLLASSQTLFSLCHGIRML